MPSICKNGFRFGANQEILRRCNGMAGGVLLAAALVHLLPDAQKVKGLRGPSWAFVVEAAGIGAFGVFFVFLKFCDSKFGVIFVM